MGHQVNCDLNDQLEKALDFVAILDYLVYRFPGVPGKIGEKGMKPRQLPLQYIPRHGVCAAPDSRLDNKRLKGRASS